jgi:hypothetical protein
MLDQGMLFVRLGAVVTYREVSGDPMLRGLDLYPPWPVKTESGAHRITTTASELPVLSIPPRAIVLDPIICRTTAQCSSDAQCDGFFCIPATCPLPAPFGAICISGVYVLNDNATSGGSVVITTPVVINGSLTLTNSSAITIQSNASITVSGCLTVGGDLIVKLPFESSQASGNITVIEFGGGYCEGMPGQFNSTTVVSEGAPPCTKVSSTAQYGERSISLLYQYDISGCGTPSLDASVAALTTGAIVGIAVGGAALVGIILATVFYARFRRKVMPYDARRKAQTDDHELE